MAKTIRLKAADGHELDAYLAEPAAKPLGVVVVVQEIFGLTAHITRVADQYAAEGYLAIAPAMFDRIRERIVLEYSEVQKGIEYMQQLKWPNTLADVQAAIDAVHDAGGVAITGFCWGATATHVAASELEVTCAVAYYGGGIARMLDKRPRVPIMYHFGDQDGSIPLADVEKIKSAYPDAVVHVYEGAGHGFSCEDRQSFSPPDARLAFARSLAFIREQLA
jgi:carboxymethylenebutenolidase